jgi:hypothetical protein
MRRIVRLAAILNLTYFGVEFAVALAIGSVSLFADRLVPGVATLWTAWQNGHVRKDIVASRKERRARKAARVLAVTSASTF